MVSSYCPSAVWKHRRFGKKSKLNTKPAKPLPHRLPVWLKVVWLLTQVSVDSFRHPWLKTTSLKTSINTRAKSLNLRLLKLNLVKTVWFFHIGQLLKQAKPKHAKKSLQKFSLVMLLKARLLVWPTLVPLLILAVLMVWFMFLKFHLTMLISQVMFWKWDKRLRLRFWMLTLTVTVFPFRSRQPCHNHGMTSKKKRLLARF